MKKFSRLMLSFLMALTTYVSADDGLSVEAGIMAGDIKAQPDWHYVGTGYRLGSSDIVFYEYHRFIVDQDGYIQSRYVEYRLSDHSLKSIKRLDYSSGAPWTPSFSYEDQRLEYRVGVKVKDKQGLLYRATDQIDYEETGLAIEEKTVIDAGFDAFIQKVWPRLQSNETVFFRTFAPLKLDQYDFAIKSLGESEGRCQLEMSLDWWPIELFISPVQLEYDCASQRLLRYHGITNLRDEDYHQITADIHYQWYRKLPPFRFER